MNKKFLFLGSVGVLALAPIAIVACSIRTQTNTQVTAESPRIALADPDNPRWIDSNNRLLDAFDALKIGAASSITKLQTEQNAFLNSAIAGGTKGLIIGAVDETAAAAVNSAAAKNIPVVAYDRLINGTDKYSWYTTFDNAEVGKLQGLYVVSGIYGRASNPFKSVEEIKTFLATTTNKLQTETFVYTLAGAPTDNNSKIFYDNGKAVIDEAMSLDTNLKYIRNVKSANSETFQNAAVENWNYTIGQQSATTFLTSLSADERTKLKGFLSPNDQMANAAIAAMRASSVDPTKVSTTGQDFNAVGVRHIEENTQLMTIFKPDSQLSVVAANILKILMEEATKSATDTKLTAQQIFDKVKEVLPQNIKDVITFNTTEYKPTDSHTVNAIIIKPIAVDKNNLSQFKDNVVG